MKEARHFKGYVLQCTQSKQKWRKKKKRKNGPTDEQHKAATKIK